MKKNFFLTLSFFIISFYQSQNIKEVPYSNKGKSINAFTFNQNICNKNTIEDLWEKFIKNHHGKVKGGFFSKITGDNIKFDSSETLWEGTLVTDEKNSTELSITVYFMNNEGEYLNSKNYSNEINSAKKSLEKFSKDLNLNCISNELKSALAYKESLLKEQKLNLNKIKNLTKENTKHDKELNKSHPALSITKREFNQIQKTKDNLSSNKIEIENLNKRNINLDEELNAQVLVIQNIQEKLKEAERN